MLEGVSLFWLAAWGVEKVKVVCWCHWHEKHQPRITLVNFLILDRAHVRSIKLSLLRRPGFANKNVVRTVPQRLSLIF